MNRPREVALTTAVKTSLSAGLWRSSHCSADSQAGSWIGIPRQGRDANARRYREGGKGRDGRGMRRKVEGTVGGKWTRFHAGSFVPLPALEATSDSLG